MNSRRENGLHLLTLSLPDHDELFVTASALDGESPGETLARAAGALEGTGATILTQEIFGAEHDERALREAFGSTDVDWPITRVLTSIPSGTQLWATTGLEVERLRHRDEVIGSLWSDRHARYCRVGGLGPLAPGASKTEQVTDTFERMEAILEGVGMGFPNLARTWLYLDRILDWYGDFNLTRDAFFTSRGIFDGLVPASTGMAGSNPAGTALGTGLIAVQPHGGEARLEMVPSPLQCPALEYGSSFSRALEVSTPDLRRLYVSGTASIGPNGLEIVHVGDTEAQVARTVEVITAIIESRGMSWNDATRAVAYFKHAEDVGLFKSNRERLGLPELPVLLVENDVCFPELLFELEVDTVSTNV